MKNQMAKGGIFEHGLEIGDKITGRNGLNKVEGYNKEMRETFTTDLDKGKRSRLRYAKGGSTRDRGALSKGEKEFIQEELKNGKGEGFSYRAKVLFGQDVVIRSKNGTPIKKWAFDNFTIAKKIADKLNQGNTMAKGGKTKKAKEPMIVRGYFEDEAIDYAKGGEIGKELMGGQPQSEPKPSGAILLEVRRNGKEIIVSEDGGKTKESYVKSNGFSGYTLRYKGNQYEFTHTLMADGGEVGADNYKVVKIFRKSGRKEILRKYLTREEAMRVVNSYPNSNTSMVVFTKMFEQGGSTSGYCYSIGGL
jgi:hypothetical protein